MATKPSCDVYDTTKNVKQYQVVVYEIADGEVTADARLTPLLDTGVKDLCPRAYERLEKKIWAGVSEPVAKPRKPKTKAA